MPEPHTGPAGERRMPDDIARGAPGMTCGRFVDVAHFEIAAHKRHDSATWAARTNVKTYTARRDVDPLVASVFAPLAGPLVTALVAPLVAPLVGSLVGPLVGSLVGPLVGSLVGPLADSLPGPLPDSLTDSLPDSRTSSASTRTASASCPAGVLP
jgi:hypothetical protein